MKFLDSTFLIDFLRSDSKAVSIASKLSNEFLATSSINIFEVMLGIYLDSNKSEEKLNKFRDLVNNLNIFSFEVDDSLIASRIAAQLIKDGGMIDDLDSLIVGVMKANNIFEIITRDKHFSRIKGIKVLSY